MSYILDALRRADAERERGNVPSIHAQTLPLLSDELALRPRMPSAWSWVVAALVSVSVVAGAAAWLVTRGDSAAARARAPGSTLGEPAEGAATHATPALRPAQESPAPRALVAPSEAGTAPKKGGAAPTPAPRAQAPAVAPPVLPPPAQSRQPPPAVAAVPAPADERQAAAAPSRTSAAPATATSAGTTRARIPPANTKGAATAQPETTPTAAPETPPARVHALHELPEDVRRGVAGLTVNGSVYSKNPADRFLVLNGQIVHEGATVAPDIVLEQIGVRAAVLSAHGYRFEIAY